MKARRPPALKVGARIGADLTVLGILDRGGPETVYIVWHHRAWCPMACKVFRSPSALAREAHVLGALAHPNTVRFLGVGKPRCLLMEFLEGPTLRRLIRESKDGRLHMSDALRVAIHLGAALQHVHARGFLHLDVKPRNVILTHGRPVLFDFGSARLLRGYRPEDLAGTDAYMAPEESLREMVTPAADMFGLGVTLYEMLTGELPFRDGTRRKPFPQVDESPTPMRTHRPTLQKGLDAIVLSCLAREPSKRPAIAALLPALHDFIRGGPAMWPEGFRPDAPVTAASKRRPKAARRPG